MASIAQPNTGNQNTFLRPPSTGRIEYSPKTGEFRRLFRSVYDEYGNKTQDYRFEPVKNPKFIIIATGFFCLSGGKMERDGTFTAVSLYGSPLICYDKGFRFDQVINVKVGSDNRPRISGPWKEISEQVKEMYKGKYTEVIFVIAADYPDELLTLEMTGYEITSLGDAVKSAGLKYTSDLVRPLYTMTAVKNEAYTNAMGVTFQKPIFEVKKFDQTSKGYDTFYEKCINLSIQVDAFSDQLVAQQVNKDGQAFDGHTVTRAEISAQPTYEDQYQAPPIPAYDDLPF